jgi:hypothetical protein
VPPHWCRVSLLEDSYTFEGMYTNTTRSPLTAYSTLIYVDVDVVFDEAALLGVAQSKLSSSSSNKNDTTLWHVSSGRRCSHNLTDLFRSAARQAREERSPARSTVDVRAADAPQPCKL